MRFQAIFIESWLAEDCLHVGVSLADGIGVRWIVAEESKDLISEGRM